MELGVRERKLARSPRVQATLNKVKVTLGKRVRRLDFIPTEEKHLLDFEELRLKKGHTCSWEVPDDTWQSGNECRPCYLREGH